MVGMVLGMILMKKRYSKSQIFAVTIVTIGVIYATTSAKASSPQKSKPQDFTANAGDYAIGVFMLTVALVISSLMGLLQEATYQKYGAEWREGLFYSVSERRLVYLNIYCLLYDGFLLWLEV